MKILLMSDNHLTTGMKKIIIKQGADINIHTGDSQLLKTNSDMELFDYTVRGNCDFERYNELEMLEIDNLKWLIIHGHQVFNAHDLDELAAYAKSYDCQVICFGHIHMPIYAKRDGVIILNAGSFSRTRSTYPNSYIEVITDENEWHVHLYASQTGKLIKELAIDEH